MKIKNRLVKLLLPWIAAVVTQFRYIRRISLILDRWQDTVDEGPK